MLAATSVLGDLMHKCPPAENCRDAFERMSKATVQMCLSTTGFGSQVDMSRIQAAAHGAGNLYSGRRQAMNQRHQGGQGQVRRSTQSRTARPVPKFDMNLADLFSDTNTPLADRSRTDSRPPGTNYAVRPETAEAVAPGLTRPFVQRTPSMEYYMKYEGQTSPQQQGHPQFYYGNSPPQSGSPGSVAHSAGGPHGLPPPDAENQQGISLDFLDFAPGDPENQAMGQDPNAEYNLAGMPTLGQNVGIDLGFGMAMDFQHDWSENPNYDILEGYFFGGSGAGAPGGDQ